MTNTRPDPSTWAAPVEVRCQGCADAGRDHPRLIGFIARPKQFPPPGSDWVAPGEYDPEVHMSVVPSETSDTVFYRPTRDEWCLHVVQQTRMQQRTREQIRSNGRKPRTLTTSFLSLPMNRVQCPNGCGMRELDRDKLVDQLKRRSPYLVA